MNDVILLQCFRITFELQITSRLRKCIDVNVYSSDNLSNKQHHGVDKQ